MEKDRELALSVKDQRQPVSGLFTLKPTLLAQSYAMSLAQLEQAYCICGLELPSYKQQNSSPSIVNQINHQEETKDSIPDPRSTRGRRAPRVSPEHRTAFLRSRYAILHRQLDAVDDPACTIVRGRRKVARSLNRQASTRRSRFTGVFKNHAKWQALIDIFDRKTYIHSYMTEQEAARAYDLMSLVLKGLAGLTNFDYSKKEVLDLISNHSGIIDKFCS